MALPIYLLFITFFLIPFQLFSISTYGVSLFDFALLLFYLKFFFDLIRNKITFQTDRISLAILFLLCFSVLLSGLIPLISGQKDLIIQYFKTSVHFFSLVFIPIIVSLIRIEEKIWYNAIKIWLVLGFVINLFGIYQIIARAYDLPFAWLEISNISLTGRGLLFDVEDLSQLSLSYGNFYRATSIFSEPSALAGFNVGILIFLVIPIIQKKQGFFKNKIYTYVFAIFSLITLFLTFSLTGLLSFLTIFLSIFIFEKFKRALKYAIITLCILFVVLGLTDKLVSSYADISVAELFKMRVEGIIYAGKKEKDFIGGESFGSRAEAFEKSFRIWKKSPIIGVGIGLTAYQKEDIAFADTSNMQVLAETGLIGAVLYFMMFFILFFRSLKLKRYLTDIDFVNDETSKYNFIPALLVYFVIFHFIINYTTANNFVTCASWLPLSIVFATLNNYQNKFKPNSNSVS